MNNLFPNDEILEIIIKSKIPNDKKAKVELLNKHITTDDKHLKSFAMFCNDLEKTLIESKPELKEFWDLLQREKRTPKKIDIPLKAGEPDPGIYGNAATMAKAMTIIQTR